MPRLGTEYDSPARRDRPSQAAEWVVWWPVSWAYRNANLMKDNDVGYDSNCCDCPYLDQWHLDQSERTLRADPPVEAEENRSDVLIVALAPGVEEWQCGRPLMPVVKPGGSAGRRVELSWAREGKLRCQFDIIEAVQCYPGRGERERDMEPSDGAVRACQGRLRAKLEQGKYRKAIALGPIAERSLRAAARI